MIWIFMTWMMWLGWTLFIALSKWKERKKSNKKMISIVFLTNKLFPFFSFTFSLSIGYTRTTWPINRVRRVSNHWPEMMTPFTGRRSIHFPMRQMLHDRLAANRFDHIHATTLTHGIWKIMHIFKGTWEINWIYFRFKYCLLINDSKKNQNKSCLYINEWTRSLTSLTIA